jgi:tRNA(Ile)-lysidine synthetase-like protein
VGLLLQLTGVRAREALARELRRAAVRLTDLFDAGRPIVVGYSGGQDSTALLHALANRRPRPALVAVHVDHALRPDSAADAVRVVEAGAAMGVGVEVVRVDVAAYRAGLPGWSIQQAARAARYHALAHAAQMFGASAVLVAHTADDQAETVLLNLLRGAGLAGLSGMRLDETVDPQELGPVPAEWPSAGRAMRLARPLLRVSRSTTLAYCAELGLSVVEDASNQSRTYTRNRVRLDLLPALEAFNPAIRTVLARTADLAGDDVAALETMVDQVSAALSCPAPPDEVAYDLAQWRLQPRALQRRVLRRALHGLLGTLVDVRAAPIEDALDVLASATLATAYHLPYGVDLTIEADKALFRLRKHGQAMPPRRSLQRLSKTRGLEAPRV